MSAKKEKLKSNTASITAEVIGLGKAGLPLAAVIADAGIKVIGVDINSRTVQKINAGDNPVPEEPGLAELIRKHRGKNLVATGNPAHAAKKANVHIVIVPLFIDEQKKPDFSMIEKAMAGIAKGLKKNDIIVLETTVPVGTTAGRIKKLLEKISGMKAGSDFYLAFSPERIMTGYSISRFREFPKIVGGINNESTDAAFKFYSHFSNIKKVRDAGTAEMAKIVEGVFRDVNIALANELYLASEKLGLDFWEVREAAKHQYCNLLEPGNVGGHCIPVYPWFLINDSALDVPLTRQARNVNDRMIEHYASKLAKITAGKKNAKIAVAGLSYREGVKEHAYARSIPLIQLLLKKGFNVYGADPMYSAEEISRIFRCKPIEIGRLNSMDGIVLMNKNEEFRNQLSKIRNKVVDVKNILK